MNNNNVPKKPVKPVFKRENKVENVNSAVNENEEESLYEKSLQEIQKDSVVNDKKKEKSIKTKKRNIKTAAIAIPIVAVSVIIVVCTVNVTKAINKNNDVSIVSANDNGKDNEKGSEVARDENENEFKDNWSVESVSLNQQEQIEMEANAFYSSGDFEGSKEQFISQYEYYRNSGVSAGDAYNACKENSTTNSTISTDDAKSRDNAGDSDSITPTQSSNESGTAISVESGFGTTSKTVSLTDDMKARTNNNSK